MKNLLSLSLIMFFVGFCDQVFCQFPLQLSDNGRYVIDADAKPFLIKEFSAWGLIQALPEDEAFAFLDSVKIRGFNTVMTSIVSNASGQMGGDPPYWQGIPPFEKEWDFSNPNETYWKHVDRFLQMAENKGFFVLLVPCYLGYYTDPGQGWWDELQKEPDAANKMAVYGEFLGQRYAQQKNIAWVAGGDHPADGIYEPLMKNIIWGIKKYAPSHLWTGHFDNSAGLFWSTDNEIYRDLIDIDGLYVWKEISLGERGPHYRMEINQYQKGKMIIQLDQSYEHDVPHYADNENPQWIRRKMYDGLLSGCSGTSFSSGTLNNQCYWFKEWQPLMNTSGMQFVSNCFKLFDSLPWHSLVPDTTDRIIVRGRGTYGEREYICSARTPDGSLYLMYIPSGHTFYLNLQEISGHTMRMHWYNPRTGVAIRIGHAGGDPSFGVVAPDSEDWVMVFDNLPDWKIPSD